MKQPNFLKRYSNEGEVKTNSFQIQLKTFVYQETFGLCIPNQHNLVNMLQTL